MTGDDLALCEPIEFADDPTALYRLYDREEVLLYVGITVAPAVRMMRHAETQSWWPEVARKTMVWYPDRVAASAAETAVIAAERPRENIRQTSSPNASPIGPRLRVADADADLAARYEAGLAVRVSPNRTIQRKAGPGWS